MQASKAVDLALSFTALYTSVRGTTAPFTAAQEERGKASNDWVRKLGITRIPIIYHGFLLLVTGWQCHRLLQLNSTETTVWKSSGAHTMFRLMTVVNILGGALRVICFLTLGRFFTFDLAVQPDQKVIQSGPYASVRHPSYSAMLLHQAGFTFTLVYGPLVPVHWRQRAAWINAALTLIASILINLRIRDEEKMLLTELGDQYKVYMRKVPSRIVPFIF